MTVIDCPACRGRSNYTILAKTDHRPRILTRDNGEVYAAFICDNTDCHFVVGGLTHGRFEDPGTLLEHWPQVLGGKEYPDVPTGIASVADEVHRCHNIGADRATIGLARSVIEAVAKDHGITSGTIEAKIDAMAARSIIGEDTKEAAHAIRQVGNDAMHGDLATTGFDEQDAIDVVNLMDDVLVRAYQNRARTAGIVERRQARKNSSQPSTP